MLCSYTADYFLKKDGTEGEGKRERKQRVKPKEKVQVEGEDEEDDGFQVVGKRNKPKKEQVRLKGDCASCLRLVRAVSVKVNCFLSF